MNPKSVHTRLLVPDVGVCYKFYRDVLDLVPKFEADESVYAEFDVDGDTLALFQQSIMSTVVSTAALPAAPAAQDRAVLCFEVPDVDAAAAGLKAKGVTFVTDPHDEPEWMLRVAHFRDPAGNLIELNAGLTK